MRWFCSEVAVTAVIRDKRSKRIQFCEQGPVVLAKWLTGFQWEECIVAFLRRASIAAEGVGAGPMFTDPVFMKDWPALYEYMTEQKFPDGKPRKTCSLTIFGDDGQVKACLNDREDNLVLFASGKTMKTALNALEGLLTAPETPWRKSSFGRTQAVPKGKQRG
jgi:hypothetical protein